MAAGSPLSAQHYLPFQGKLFNADDQPINGTHTFTFSITDGGINWTETQSNVQVYQGIYAVVLGSQAPLPDGIFAVSAMHTLQIQMDGQPLDNVMIYRPIENDPKVPDELKDGVSWDEVTGKPPMNAVPVGTVVSFAGPKANIPDGWLPCEGQLMSSTGEYAALFSVIGTTWGGNGAPNFRLPDLRGVFLRGVNDGRTDDFRDTDTGLRINLSGQPLPGIGSYQADELKSHSHLMKVGTWVSGAENGSKNVHDPNPVIDPNTPSTHVTGGSETRPKNAAVYFIIKAKAG